MNVTELNTAILQLRTQLQSDLTKLSGEQLRATYLGKKGFFNELAGSLKDMTAEDKKMAGLSLNQLKQDLETTIAQQSAQTKTNTGWVDVTMPGLKPVVGHLHPISQAMAEITNIFERIGFTRVRYPEVDWDWYPFESLNMPPDHPARDEWETFFVEWPDKTQGVTYDPNNIRARHPDLIGGGKMVLTPHTSNGQVREMERLHSQPPIRMINMARCYRRQQDATHTQMFHQFEGLVVDKGITIQHLKGTLDYFAQEFYGPGTKSRIRPFHFQFTEPSFEVDFSCHVCGGTGEITTKSISTGTSTANGVSSDSSSSDSLSTNSGETKSKCKFCKSGWHEVGGAGMVHPNVLMAGCIDPEQYTGFAFGWGVERTYTLKEGLNIDDIRLLYSGDLRFLEQF